MISTLGRTKFTLILFAFVTYVLYLTLDLGSVARMVPLQVAIPTLAVITIQLVLDLVPVLAQKFSPFEKIRFAGTEALQNKTLADGPGSVTRTLLSRRELCAFFWIFLMLLYIYVFGILLAVPLYTFLYLTIRAKERWLLSIVMAATLSGLVYGVFVLLLDASLYRGHLWDWLGF
jgi:hypothetical protein